jgi:leucyl-tRNA synthetase
VDEFGKGSDYDPVSTELRWQEEWRRRRSYATPDEQHPGPSSYVYAASPFTSGDVHIGHVRSYSIADAYARLRRATGDAVLYSMGYDSFGLPAEEAATRNDLPPADWIARCRKRMTSQFERIGFSLDWDRTFTSSDPEMYRWSQWLFLEFLREGFVYRATESVDWCPRCETVLARLQVEDGCCWRCHGAVSAVEKQQWFLRVTAYGEENEEALARLSGWDELMSASQRTVSGRVDGVEIDGMGPDGEPIVVFTPYPQAVAEARFVAISPRHPEIERWSGQPGVREELVALRKGGWQRATRKADSLAVLDTGLSATVPGAAPERMPPSPSSCSEDPLPGGRRGRGRCGSPAGSAYGTS